MITRFVFLGLRIAPPEAETTGASFGRGIYFADVFDKSVSYVGYDDDGIGIDVLFYFVLFCFEHFLSSNFFFDW